MAYRLHRSHIGTGFKRYSVKAGLESQVHSKVKVGITSYYAFSKADLGSLETLRSALRARPTGTVFTKDLQPNDAAGDKDWNGYSLFMGINDNQVINPVVEAQPENYQRENRTSAFIANAVILVSLEIFNDSVIGRSKIFSKCRLGIIRA